MPDIWIIYSTFGTRAEALSASRSVIEKRLVACANLHDNVTSMYRWENALVEETEIVLIAKTTAQNREAAQREIQRLNTYKVPCIIAFPVAEGFPLFMEWIANSTAE